MNRADFSKWLSMLMTGIIYVGLGFTAGFCLSEFLTEDAAPSAQTVSAVQTTPAPQETYTPAPVITEEPEYYGVRYLVRAQDGELVLYETEGEQKKILRKSKITVNSFPARDAQELENGITAGTLEGALEVWESFME